ncbi:helix-turn-helix domain-containing protein [Gordonia sp. LSe1-13]|uniref:Helix-turn-helix domain-containing protein n=1 Tax=Gordonia sesuvii TaxID=3116777 RepID=A0ABU7MEM6_9ACTN|nr:helix-turn-helix domain-containing protein [Gordonia sp. LSe1-13]
MTVPQSGLDPAIIDRWWRVNGAGERLGTNRSRQVRTRGRHGIETYAEFVDLDAGEPDDFEQLALWRPMSNLIAFSILQTAVRTRRTAHHIREYPSNFLIVAVQTMGSTTGTANNRDFVSRPGQLTVTDSRIPYDLTTHGVTDATGIWVPSELVGGDIAGGATVAPVPPDTLLTRSCAGLIVRIARDTAFGGADVDLDTELAVIDVVRAMLEQDSPQDNDLRENPLFLREAVDDLIERNFRDPTFGPEVVAQRLHISRRNLYRGLEGHDLSLTEMIADRRLEFARALLAQGDRVRLEGIAESAGFSSAATLRNRFRAKFGMTPDEYRRQMADVPPHQLCGDGPR